ncbi:MAG TPA: redoxin domain-containing protein [Ktedonobacterales bacterium]|nr:redoxin domain-containing protein [Ktedonobacterales bacterium]
MANTTSEQGATCGVLAPDFTLKDVARPADAPSARLRTWRQRKPVLLALLPAHASAQNASWLRTLAERADDLAFYEAVTLAIAPEPEARRLLGEVDAPVPLLADEDGATLAAYLGDGAALPALAVIDRYNSLAALLPASGPGAAPDVDAALRELSYADQQDCACTLPAWEN